MIALAISTMLIYTVVLLVVALGGMFSERSGVINIALEGVMIIGGAVAVVVLASLPTDMNGFLKILLIVLAASVAGALYSLLLAFASIHMKADQTIGGTALNVLGLAAAIVFVKIYNAKASGGSTTNSSVDMIRDGLYFEIFGVEMNLFLPITILILIASWVVLYKTKFGLQIRACGENPHAADSAGINVIKYRYVGVLISGVLAGIGGAAYCIISSSRWNSLYGVAGFGFLALAVMIFGQWKPMRIALAALLFSFFKTLAVIYSYIPFLKNLGFSSNIYNMLPFLACLIILAFTSKNSKAPKAEGIPYDKGQR